MENMIATIISKIEIPLKILLPTIMLVCGFLLFANEDVLKTLYLLDFKKEHGFVIGISFLVSAVLIIIYIARFIKDRIIGEYNRLTFHNRVINDLSSLGEGEWDIILGLYHNYSYSGKVDYADPIVKGLIARGYIYMGNNTFVSQGWDDKMMISVTLQPFVRESLNKEYLRISNKIKKLEQKLNKEKDQQKKNRIKTQIEELSSEREIFRR